MKKFPLTQNVILLALLASCFLSLSACEKKAPITPTSPDQTPSHAAVNPQSLRPAIVGREQGSFASYIHFPKDPGLAKLDVAVQFYCDVNENGTVQTTYAVVTNQPAFKTAVQSALDWGKFTPATVDGKPVSVYLGGTVLFAHQNGEPLIVVSLATYDRARVGRLTNYVQPQLIGGLRHYLERAVGAARIDIPTNAVGEILVKVGEHCEISSTSILSENPPGIGLGNFLLDAIKDGQFTSAYADGKIAAGAINIIANFGAFF